jgi:hypothetical protein
MAVGAAIDRCLGQQQIRQNLAQPGFLQSSFNVY